MSSRDEVDLDALIADARNRGDALRTLFPNDGDIRDDARLYETLADALESTLAELRQERERAKVFEQAHTPTDDEKFVKSFGGWTPDEVALYPRAAAEVIERLRSRVIDGFRRTVQVETEG